MNKIGNIQRLAGLLLLCATTLFVGCTDDYVYSIVEPADDTVTLTARLQVAGGVVVDTRLSGAQESAFASLQALVFDDEDKYQYTAPTDVSGSTVSVKLRRTVSSTDLYSVVFIANADISGVTLIPDTAATPAATTLAEAQQALTFAAANGTYAATASLPLWGQTAEFATNENSTQSVNMIRSVARIDLDMDDALKSNDYTLTKFYIFNSRTAGCLMPAPANYNSSTKLVTAPSVPTTGATATDNDHPADYSDAIQNGDSVVRSIYLPENASGGESGTPTSLVLGITKDGAVSYYRVEIKATATGTDTPRLPVLRNHLYKFTVKSVTGLGYATPAEAAAAKPWNVDWDLEMDDDMGATYVKNGYFIETPTALTVPGDWDVTKNNKGTVITIETNTVNQAELTALGTYYRWITSDPEEPALSASATFSGGTATINITVNTFHENTTGAARDFVLQVGLPHIDSFEITITQDKLRERYEITNVTVNGLYLPRYTRGDGITRDFPLQTDIHTLTVELKTETARAYASSSTAAWRVYSDELNGYRFEGSGNFFGLTPTKVDGSYTYFAVTAQGYDVTAPSSGGVIPKNSGYNFFTLHTDGLQIANENPSGYKDNNGNDLLVRVLCGYRTKTIASYGYYAGSTLGYAANKGYSRQMLDEPNNYGLSGKVPIEGFDQTAYAGVNGYTAFFARLADATTPPDIAIIGYNFNLKSNTNDWSGKLKAYIDRGGVVIMMIDGNPAVYSSNIVNNFLTKYEPTAAKGTTLTAQGTSYQLATGGGTATNQPPTDDPIANGPFGDLWGAYWGNDRYPSSSVLNLNGKANFIIYSNASTYYGYMGDMLSNPGGGANMFRLNNTGALYRKAGLFFVGDGGFTARRNATRSRTAIPFLTNAGNYPMVNTAYEPNVSNAIIFANVMYWAIDYAEFYGPNRIVEPSNYTPWNK